MRPARDYRQKVVADFFTRSCRQGPSRPKPIRIHATSGATSGCEFKFLREGKRSIRLGLGQVKLEGAETLETMRGERINLIPTSYPSFEAESFHRL